jgi:hypothetical protein
MREHFAIDPLIGKRQQLLLATQLCRMVLKVCSLTCLAWDEAQTNISPDQQRYHLWWWQRRVLGYQHIFLMPYRRHWSTQSGASAKKIWWSWLDSYVKHGPLHRIFRVAMRKGFTISHPAISSESFRSLELCLIVDIYGSVHPGCRWWKIKWSICFPVTQAYT